MSRSCDDNDVMLTEESVRQLEVSHGIVVAWMAVLWILEKLAEIRKGLVCAKAF